MRGDPAMPRAYRSRATSSSPEAASSARSAAHVWTSASRSVNRSRCRPATRRLIVGRAWPPARALQFGCRPGQRLGGPVRVDHPRRARSSARSRAGHGPWRQTPPTRRRPARGARGPPAASSADRASVRSTNPARQPRRPPGRRPMPDAPAPGTGRAPRPTTTPVLQPRPRGRQPARGRCRYVPRAATTCSSRTSRSAAECASCGLRTGQGLRQAHELGTELGLLRAQVAVTRAPGRRDCDCASSPETSSALARSIRACHCSAERPPAMRVAWSRSASARARATSAVVEDQPALVAMGHSPADLLLGHPRRRSARQAPGARANRRRGTGRRRRAGRRAHRGRRPDAGRRAACGGRRPPRRPAARVAGRTVARPRRR